MARYGGLNRQYQTGSGVWPLIGVAQQKDPF